MSFIDKLTEAIDHNNSLLCIGLDPVLDKLPETYRQTKQPLLEFSRYIIDQTSEYVMAYKPNSAFFEAYGAPGIEQLKQTCDYIKDRYPDVLIILDAKRGDIGTSNEGYISYAFDYLGADAITLHPYLGKESIQPFLDISEKGSIILCRTSNPGAGELQDLPVEQVPLYQSIAKLVASSWNVNKNCMLVVGATFPEELSQVRQIVGDLPILVPGIGAQGGDLTATLQAGLADDKKGLVITVSRSVLYAENPGDEARKLRDAINAFRVTI